MRTVTLGQTGITTTVLGYGCTGLMRPNAEDRLGLLTAAFEAGIRHFDVARYYGFGGAEGVLGNFLRQEGVRDAVTITTKFGLKPSPLGQSSRGRSLVNFARRVAGLHPGLRKILGSAAKRSVRANRFDVESARRSLETSLKELATDRIDLFLLHEATLDDTRTEGLLEFLQGVQREGKIRAFGLGSDLPRTLEIVTAAPAFTRVIQVANGFGHWDLERLPADPQSNILTHGALKILPGLEAALDRNPLPDWEKLESPRGSALAGLLLGLAMHGNPAGVTLFSSTQPQRIRDNVAQALRYDKEGVIDWPAFRRLVEQTLGSPKVNVH